MGVRNGQNQLSVSKSLGCGQGGVLWLMSSIETETKTAGKILSLSSYYLE